MLLVYKTCLESSYIFIGELGQRALIGTLTFDFLPPGVATPDFQAFSTEEVLNNSRR